VQESLAVPHLKFWRAVYISPEPGEIISSLHVSTPYAITEDEIFGCAYNFCPVAAS